MAVSGIKAVLRRLRVVAGRGGARLAVVLALVVATLSAVYPASARATGDVSLQPVDGFTFGVMSDPHYFPAEYQGTRAEAYQNQTSGDLRLMGENEALTTAAVDQMIAEGNLPSVLLVTGDLSSEGEQASHEGFAEQMARLQDAGVAVLVIPGNHDLYNDSAMTFQDDTQVRDNGTGELYTTEAEFREIYATMGYDEEATKAASNGAIESIDYYKPVSNGEVADCQGGLSYVARTNAGVAFLMIDTEVYTADFNGQGKAAGSGGGMMSDELRAWVKFEAAKLTEEGYTIIAGVHHPVLNHQTTAETEFITDRIDVQSGEGTAKDNSNIIATELADAGIHYVFSGHMHENDVASYTTAAGNTIYDMETGGLCAYPSPYRLADVTTTEAGEISLSLQSVSVKQAPMNQKLDAPNGELVDTEPVDVQEYERNAMYGDREPAETGESFITRLVMRYAARYLDQLVDIPGALQNIAGIDLYDLLFNSLLPSVLGEPLTLDLGGSIGVIEVSYDTAGVHLNPTSGLAGVLSSYTVRSEDIQTEVQSVLDQIEANYIANGRLEQEISALLENVGDVNLLNPENPVDTSGRCYTLRQLLQDMFQRHNSGEDAEPMSAEMQEALENLASSPILQRKVEQVLSEVLFPLIDEVLANTHINLDTLFGRNVLWSTAIEAVIGAGSNPSIAQVLDKFGLDLTGEGGVLQGLIDQYLTASVYNQIGGLVNAMVSGFAADGDGFDDVVDGEAVVLEASMNPGANPTQENGALPSQVSMSLDADGEALSRNFSWYTSTDIEGSDVQVVSAEGIESADDAATVMEAGGEGVTSASGATQVANKAKVTLNLILITNYEIVQENRHTATVEVPAGDFYYRVGDAGRGFWTEPVFVDGDAEDADEGYTAIVVADSQGASQADYDAYEQVLAEAEESTVDEAFAIHLGDMVDDGANENYWNWLMNTDASMAVATMPVAGNHEARQDDDALENAVAAHYNVDIPEQDTSTGIYYSFVYGDVTYIVLNTNDGDSAVGQAQREWAADVADSAETTWKVLITHKAPYSKGSHQNDADVVALRGWLNTFCTQYDIDLVLSGHDHTYMRTPALSNGAEVEATTTTAVDSEGNEYQALVNPSGTTFVIPSTSGSKYYDIVENDLPCEVSWQGYQPVWSTLKIEGDALFWQSYAYDASSNTSVLIDSFAIAKDDNLTPAEEVMRLIEKLPDPDAGSEDILAAQQAIEEARAAYEALEEADKEQVSNLSKLEQLEQLVEVYQDIAGKETVDLSTGIYYDGQNDDEGQRREAFKEAISNPEVGTIILPGDYSTAIGEYSGNTLNNQYYTVDHNVVIKAADGAQGFADLRRCGFIVTDGATLVLEDVKLQAWQKKPFIGSTTPMNMIRVEDGTLIANGNTSVLVNRDNGSTDGFKDESWRGHAIIMGNPDNSSATGERAVYLNLSDSGTISGLRDSVVQHAASSSADDHVYINGGTFNTIYSGNSSVNLSCGLDITGGTFTKVTSYGDLAVDGGTFNGGSVDYPIWMGDGANLYIGDVEGISAGTTGKLFHVTGELHIADAALSKLSGTSLAIEAGQGTSSGWPLTATTAGLGEGQEGAIYVLGEQITTVSGMAANQHGALETATNGAELSAVATLAPDQVVFAYARYHASSDSVLAGYVDGNTGGIYAYSGYVQLSNPTPTIELSSDAGLIVTKTAEGDWPQVELTAPLDPGNATPHLTWASSDEDVAAVDENGLVTFKAPGRVAITVTHDTTGAVARIELVAVEPQISGASVYLAESTDGERYTFKLHAGTSGSLTELPEGYDVVWTLTDDAESGATLTQLTSNQLSAQLMRGSSDAANVTVTAKLLFEGEETGIQASMDVAIEGTVTAPDAETIQGLIDVTVSDSNDEVTHGAWTTDLLPNAEGKHDSYSVSEPYRTVNGSEAVETLADQAMVLFEGDQATWKVDVTVHGSYYADAYNGQDVAEGIEHVLVSDPADVTVTLVRSADGAWSVDASSEGTVAFEVACDEELPPAPAAPTASYVASLDGVSVTLDGANGQHSEGATGSDNAHPNVTFSAADDADATLLASSFTIGEPVEQDGVWTVEVTVDCQDYLDAYAAMGDPAYGTHYFASAEETGSRAFTLVLTGTGEDAAWKLAEGEAEHAAMTFSITCLTLRPAELAIYTGGAQGDTSHFPDAHVVDGLGNVYTIDELNELLSGQTARVAYFDGTTEITTDTVPGEYEARIVIEQDGAQNRDADESVTVTVNDEAYEFALETSTLTIRNASDAADAEAGGTNVALLASDAGADEIVAALEVDDVVAQLPADTQVLVNDREGGLLEGESLAGVTLFSDELLGAEDSGGLDRYEALVARAAEDGYEIDAEHADFRYLDLVDANQSNVWVSSTEGATIYWNVPEGADPESLQVLHFAGLHREYGVNATELEQQIADCTVEAMELDTAHVEDGYVSFEVGRANFSPFVLSWEEQEPEVATVTFDPQSGVFANSDEATRTVPVGEALGELPVVTRTSYVFDGWFTQAQGGEEVTAETVASAAGAVTYYAHWSVDPATLPAVLTLNASEGVFADGSNTTTCEVAKDVAISESDLPIPTREGYVLAGWYFDEQLEQPVVFAEDADPQQGIEATTFSEDAPLYAKWLQDISDGVSLSADGSSACATYTGEALPVAPVFGEGFPEGEQAGVTVWYRDEGAGDDAWTTDAPVNAGTYDVRLTYDGTDTYAPFDKVFEADYVIAKATLEQEGLVADPAEVEAGTSLADVSLAGATVTSSVTGAEVSGSWSWKDAGATVDATGSFEAVFTPDDSENYDVLTVEVAVSVADGGGEPGGEDKPENPDEGEEDPDAPGGDDEKPGEGSDPDGSGDQEQQPGSDADEGSHDGAAGEELSSTGDMSMLLVGGTALIGSAAVLGGAALKRRERS